MTAAAGVFALALMPYAASALLLVVGLWLFVRPLREGSGGVDGDSLAGLLKQALGGSMPRSGRGSLIRLAVTLGCTAVLVPACLPMLAAFAPADARRAILISVGIALALMSVATALVFLVSGMSFGWGTPATKPATLAGRLAPAFPLVSGIATILVGVFTHS